MSTSSFEYPTLPDAYTALCEGSDSSNGFYGEGVVDALNALTGKKPQRR